MKITQDVREYAAQKEIDEQTALGVGMKEKAEEFAATGRRDLSKIRATDWAR
jgi:phosphomethylpyrimidine synthase